MNAYCTRIQLTAWNSLLHLVFLLSFIGSTFFFFFFIFKFRFRTFTQNLLDYICVWRILSIPLLYYRSVWKCKSLTKPYLCIYVCLVLLCGKLHCYQTEMYLSNCYLCLLIVPFLFYSVFGVNRLAVTLFCCSESNSKDWRKFVLFVEIYQNRRHWLAVLQIAFIL